MEAEGAALRLGGRRAGALAAARSVALSTPALGALVFLATWGGGTVAPYTPPSLDGSLHAALHLAATQGLEFGSDVVFTYGPLGFLKSSILFDADTARLAAVYGIAVHLALAISLVWALRRNFPLALAVAIALVVAVLARGDQAGAAVRTDATVVLLALIWCVAALRGASPEWTRRIVVYGGGPFAALELLAKLNTGLVVLALVAIAVAAIERYRLRNVATAAGAFAATAAVLWLAAGHGLGAVGPFLTDSLEVASGYSSGARLEWHDRGYDYLLAPVLVAIAGLIAWVSTREERWQPRAAVLAMVAIVAFTAAKGGFVSHDIFHMATFYATILGVYVAFALPPRPVIRLGVVAAIAAAAAATFTTSFAGYPMTNPVENARNGFDTVATLAGPGRLEREIGEHRAALVGAYGIDPETLALVGDRPVHIDSSEVAAAWAHRLEWRPLPVFQPYVAWTPALDRRNAEALASPADGPERILRHNLEGQGLNPLGRYPAFESPAAMIEMLCRFRPLRTTQRWQVLGRAGNRCGEPRPLGSAAGSYGTPIAIPPAPPGSLLVARAEGIDVSGPERLRTMLVRARGREVVFAGDPTRYVLIPGTASAGLLLRAPRRLDLPAPFALAPNADEVTFLLDGGAGGPIRLDFYAVPVRAR